MPTRTASLILGTGKGEDRDGGKKRHARSTTLTALLCRWVKARADSERVAGGWLDRVRARLEGLARDDAEDFSQDRLECRLDV